MDCMNDQHCFFRKQLYGCLSHRTVRWDRWTKHKRFVLSTKTPVLRYTYGSSLTLNCSHTNPSFDNQPSIYYLRWARREKADGLLRPLHELPVLSRVRQSLHLQNFRDSRIFVCSKNNGPVLEQHEFYVAPYISIWYLKSFFAQFF